MKKSLLLSLLMLFVSAAAFANTGNYFLKERYSKNYYDLHINIYDGTYIGWNKPMYRCTTRHLDLST